MKRFIIGLVAASFVLSALAGPAMAKTTKSAAKTKTAASMKCPFCGMTMTTKKTAAMPVPVKIKGVTYYCCTSCHPKPGAKAPAKKS